MSLMQNIYDRLPDWGQSIFVSAYGCKLYYERYLNNNKMINELMTSQWLSDEHIRYNQLISLKKLIVHAQESVPYYKEIFQQNGFNANYIESLDELKNLPLLSKEVVRTRTGMLVSGKFKSSRLVQVNTSGTTGTSLKMFVDLASRRRTYAFTGRFHRWAGLKNSRHNITLGGRTVVPLHSKAKTFWRYNAALDNYLFSSYHMSDLNLTRYVEKIRSIKPQFIEAYPSAAHLLAKFMDERSLYGIYPKAVITSGETLFDHQRELIERVFGCRVFDQYGCTEQALFVSQCEDGAYHVNPEYGIVEILDDDNEPLGAGKPGRVVCTSFANWAMPLIRYDLGDIAEWDGRSCSCGRHFPVMKKIFGRHDDYIITPDGRKIGRLDPIFKGVETVKLAQIIQTHIDNLTLLIVPGSKFNEIDKNRLIQELQNRVGKEITITVDMRDRIETSANGKFKAVISMLDRDRFNHCNIKH